jgi:hypothetical protein
VFLPSASARCHAAARHLVLIQSDSLIFGNAKLS